jgi:N6-L-threonylcarbamoyladenine synthase
LPDSFFNNFGLFLITAKLIELPSFPYILAIESSCDDTSAAILEGKKVLSNITNSQQVHAKYGGVVPELASRAHQKSILPVVDVALQEAQIELNQIDAIAFTRGPGLLGSLLVGTSFAKGLALGLNKPLIEVNHMRGHILAHFIEDGSPTPQLPFLCLTVSGGHTQIVKVTSQNEFEIIGETLDDAAGEAFDKIAKIMSLPYPGGPLIDKYAKEGIDTKFSFPKPNMSNYNYSFSGLKTSILYFLQKQVTSNPNFIEENKNDLCASIQKTIIDTLFKKLEQAAKDLNISEVAIAGGVSANSLLRSELKLREQSLKWNTYIPKFEYCTDNAAMIGITAYYKYLSNDFSDLKTVPSAKMKV